MSKVAARKAKLHTDLLDHAERRIAENTVGQLRARDLAKDAGCSVGAIYNVFDDLDALILHVSFRTLSHIDEVMEQAGERHHDAPPIDCMVELAWTYFDFVRGNYNLWRSLFDHTLPSDYKMPDWLKEGQHVLFRHIEAPLAHYMPDADEKRISRTARLLFSSVHGVVSISMERRAAGLPLDELKAELEFLLRTFVKGLERSS